MKEIVLPDDGGDDFDPDLEARLLALIMGEASAFEAEALEKLMRERPEVAEAKRRLEEMHGAVDLAVNSEDADWKLSPERRARVMKTLGIGNGGNGGNGKMAAGNGGDDAKEMRIRRASRTVLWAAAACLMINVILFVWVIGRAGLASAGSKAGESVTIAQAVEDQAEWSSRYTEAPDAAKNDSGRASPLPTTSSVAENRPEAPGMSGGLVERAREETSMDPFSSPEPVPLRPPSAKDSLAKLRDQLGPETEEKSAADPFGAAPDELPASELARAIASRTPAVTAVPDPERVDPDTVFGAGEDFGAGWGSGGREPGDGFGGGGAAGNVAGKEIIRRHSMTNESSELLHEGREAYARGNTSAKQELDSLDDPVRTNPALTFEQTENIGQVRRNLYTAEGYKNLGLYDQAIEEYNKALRVDQHNSAARRGLEQIHSLKSDYYRSAYDSARAALLTQVDQAWESAVPPARGGDTGQRTFDRLADDSSREPAHDTTRHGVRAIDHKLENMVIPELNLDETTVEDAIDFLRQKTRELDTFELDPTKKGLNFVVRKPRVEGDAALAPDAELDAAGALTAEDPGQARIKGLTLKNVTVEQALQAIADQANLRFKADDFAVTMLPRGFGEGEDIVTRRWKVGPGFIAQLEEAQTAGEGEADPFGDAGGLGGAALRPRRPMVEIMKEMGIEFPPGASVQFLPGSGDLIVSNTPANLDLVDQVTESLGPAEPPVPIDPRLFRRRDEPARAEFAAVEQKLKNIIIPTVDFDETTVEDAIDYLRQRSRELDSHGLDAGGLSFRIRKAQVDRENWVPDEELDAAGALEAADPGQAVVKELKLRNVPLGTVLQYICDMARLRYKIGEDGIELLPRSFGEAEDIVTRSWEVHPDVIEALRVPDYLNGDFNDPFGDAEPMTERQKEEARQAMRDRPLEEVLKESGIDFPPGGSVKYLPDTGVLVVTNTPANNDLVDQLFEMVARDLSGKQQDEELAEEALELRAAQEPFSTFSLHVSDVSFKLAKATLEKGEWPAAGQIRVEEFVNAFDYGDPMPSRAEKVACRIEQAAHPFLQQRNMVRISMRTAAAGRAGGVPLGLTVLLDHSGSMERYDRAESVRRAFDLLAMQLNANDRVTLISFARTPRLLADRIPGSEAGTLSEMVTATPSGGGTNLEEALALGLSKAREQMVEGGQNRIVLLTDGAANLGNARPEDLARVVERMRQEGIAFDACGVGAEGFNDDILESLTRKGDGRYYFLDRPEDADEGFARQIAGALRPAAKNVKVQIEFNPRRVDRYKLYGFEKHLLEKEDFRDDSVDAAELASAEAGNAVYHVQVLPEGEGAIGSVSVRFLDVASGHMVERRWTIPYREAAPRLSEAPASMKLAGSAALLGEKLNGSELGARVRLSELAETVNSLQLDYGASERVREFVEMTRQAREVGE